MPSKVTAWRICSITDLSEESIKAGGQVGGNLALKLASQVLSKELSYDEGLVRAQAGRILEMFINGLNILAGHEYFDFSQAQKRLRSGEAERAVEGEIPALTLPPDLDDWSLSKIATDFDSACQQLAQFESDMAELIRQQDEISEQLGLAEAMSRNHPDPPNPWLLSSFFLVIILGVCGFMVYQGIHITILSLFFAGGVAISGLLFMKEMKRYDEFVQKLEIEKRKYQLRIHSLQEQINEIQVKIQKIRQESHLIQLSLEDFPPEQVDQLLQKHPLLFQRNH